MKVKLLLLAAAMLAFAALSFAQPISLALNDDPFFGGQPLMTTCGGTTPIPDGEGMIYIYQDVTGDGNRYNDPLVPVCTDPPDCNLGPNGTFNMDRFVLDAASIGLDPGCFSSPINLTTSGTAPSGTIKFYVKVEYPIVHPTVRWMSEVSGSFAPGAFDQIFYTSWTCTTLVTECTGATTELILPYTGHAPAGPDLGVYGCAKLCAASATILVGPLASADRIPTVLMNSGTGCACNTPLALTPALTTFSWYQRPADGLWYYKSTLTAAGPGNVCLHLEKILPAEMGTVTITPLSNSVKVAWNTLSETNLLGFDVRRDGARIGHKDAANNATGSNYEFVDNTAVNGTTYSYELVLLNGDGTSEVVYTLNATPDLNSALVTEYGLLQNFPNPFNPSTKIAFDLKEANTVSLTIYNAAGQEVNKLLSNASYSKAGRYSISFDATNLPSGLYFYSIKIGSEFSATKKMLLVK